MDIAVDDPKTKLSDLLDRVDAGEAVTLLRAGKPLARVVPVQIPPDLAERNRKLLALSAEMARLKTPGPDAAHASDFLFDDDGLPA